MVSRKKRGKSHSPPHAPSGVDERDNQSCPPHQHPRGSDKDNRSTQSRTSVDPPSVHMVPRDIQLSTLQSTPYPSTFTPPPPSGSPTDQTQSPSTTDNLLQELLTSMDTRFESLDRRLEILDHRQNDLDTSLPHMINQLIERGNTHLRALSLGSISPLQIGNTGASIASPLTHCTGNGLRTPVGMKLDSKVESPADRQFSDLYAASQALKEEGFPPTPGGDTNVTPPSTQGGATNATPSSTQGGATNATPSSPNPVEQPEAAPSRPLPYAPVPAPQYQYPLLHKHLHNQRNYQPSPDLLFPDVPPPVNTTHYSGRWDLDNNGRRFWHKYKTPLDAQELPNNVSRDPTHWINRLYPNGCTLTEQGYWITTPDPVASNYRPDARPVPVSTPITTGLTPTTLETSVDNNFPTHTPVRVPQSKPKVSMYSNMVTNTPHKVGFLTRHNRLDLIDNGGNGKGNGHDSHGDPGNGGGDNPHQVPHGFPPGGPGDPGDPDGGDWPDDEPSPDDPPKKSRFKAKPDKTAYPTLTSNKYFDQWYEKLIIEARGQGFEDLFDKDYTPVSPADKEEYKRKNAWFFSVFHATIKTTTGKVIVKNHFQDFNCFDILVELIADAHQSVSGTLGSLDVLNWITSITYSSLKGSAVDFIVNFDETITRYNDSKAADQDKLSDSNKKLFLQRAFSKVKVLNDVATREIERMTVHGDSHSYTYEGYLEVLKKAAELYDHSNQITNRRNRSGQLATIDEIQQEEDEAKEEALQAFAASSDPSTRLPDEYYGKLTPADRTTWHSLDQDGKKLFVSLLGAKPSNTNNPLPRRQAKVAEGAPPETADLVVGDSPEDALEANQASSTGTKVDKDGPKHSAPQSKTNDSHPGDIARMMSQRQQRTGKTAARIAAFHTVEDKLDSQLESYWAQQSEYHPGPLDF